MKSIIKICLPLVVASFLVSCSSRGQFTHFGEKYPATSNATTIEIFKDSKPNQKFIEISRLDVRIENTHFVSSSFDDALPKLREQAKLSGAHAVINVEESSSSMGETRIYHVTATGIRYIKE